MLFTADNRVRHRILQKVRRPAFITILFLACSVAYHDSNSFARGGTPQRKRGGEASPPSTAPALPSAAYTPSTSDASPPLTAPTLPVAANTPITSDASPPSIAPALPSAAYTPNTSDASPRERPQSVFRELAAIIILFALNLVGWFLFWIWIHRRVRAISESREEGERRMRKRDIDFQSLENFAAGLERRLESVERQPDGSTKADGHPGRSIDNPQPLQPSAQKVPFPIVTSEADASPPPSYTPSVAYGVPPQEFVVPLPAATRDSLGEVFLAEVRKSSGEEAPMVWERFFARVKSMSPGAEYRQVYWDRAVKDVHFKDQAPSTYSDTGTCWRLNTGNQSFLFFRALVSPARQSDLPGCRIVSSDKAVLDPSKLIQFTPPTVVQDSHGWRVEAEGDVRYQ